MVWPVLWQLAPDLLSSLKRLPLSGRLWSPVQGRWDGLSLEQMAQQSTFTDFHVGQQHGWASVTRMTGRGPVLLTLPENGAAGLQIAFGWTCSRWPLPLLSPWLRHLAAHKHAEQLSDSASESAVPWQGRASRRGGAAGRTLRTLARCGRRTSCFTPGPSGRVCQAMHLFPAPRMRGLQEAGSQLAAL